MFDDRSCAGRILGSMVARRIKDPSLVVLALPRGGVPVAFAVAGSFTADVEFDVFLVRKLGVPHREELAFGAIASGGVRVLNRQIIEELGLSDDDVARVTELERLELERREHLYREDRPPIAMRDRVVILVDDGLATGASMIAAVRAVRQHEPKKVVAAVPVASRQAAAELAATSDELICARMPDPFHAVGHWYRDFDQVTDDEVREQLEWFRALRNRRANTPHSALQTNDPAESA